jgi:hypothetical protein
MIVIILNMTVIILNMTVIILTTCAVLILTVFFAAPMGALHRLSSHQIASGASIEVLMQQDGEYGWPAHSAPVFQPHYVALIPTCLFLPQF